MTRIDNLPLTTAKSRGSLMNGLQMWLWRVCVVGLILLLQGPAMLTQEIAWAGMLASYTRDRGLVRGVAETFDGEHPCGMCAKAAEMRRQEQPEKPAEKPLPARRTSLAWAEMISSELLKMPVIAGCDVAVSAIQWTAHNGGRGVEAPVPPPPERG